MTGYLNTLPPSSLPPFQVPRLAGARHVWVNKDIANGLDLRDYEFCLPQGEDPNEAYTNDTKTFMAERYGGHGVGNNGGGVRCGYDGKIQVKGIGSNFLAGKNRDFWHTHGGAHLMEAVYEAIWGEVCNIALPYGGARVYGIIATGTDTHFRGRGNTRSLASRALILRQATLRPSHYMRAIDYEPTEHVIATLATDTERTRCAINEIDLGLATVLGRQPDKRLDPDFINAGLVEMARRIASQIAASRAKRITHGALGCSNISLDGRYVDFGTITALSDYGRIKVAENYPDVWLEHLPLLSTFQNLIFYIRKYLPSEIGEKIYSADSVVQAFNAYLADRLTIEYLKLTGVPEEKFPLIDKALLRTMGRCIFLLIKAGNEEPFRWKGKQPKVMGAYHLSTIFQTACLCSSEDEILNEIAPLLDNENLRHMFASSFIGIRKQYIDTFSSEKQAQAKLFAAMNAYRLNTTCVDLNRALLEDSIRQALETHGEMEGTEKLVFSLKNQARTLLADPTSSGIDLDWYVGSAAAITENDISVASRDMVTAGNLIHMLDQEKFPDQSKRKLEKLCL